MSGMLNSWLWGHKIDEILLLFPYLQFVVMKKNVYLCDVF